jgi:8-oxo-dGTP diphosphatase
MKREYPEHPMVGIGAVVIRDNRALLIRRGSEPLKGEWSIPGGMLEIGETISEGVMRELYEETGLRVRLLGLIEVFERIFRKDEVGQAPLDAAGNISPVANESDGRPLYHFVILDYLCEAPEGEPRAGSDVTDLEFVTEEDLARFRLTPTATRVIRKAFEMSRAAEKKTP